MSISPIRSSPELQPYVAPRTDTPAPLPVHPYLRSDATGLEAIPAAVAQLALERASGVDLPEVTAREIFLETAQATPLPPSPHSSARSSPEYSPPVDIALIPDTVENIPAVVDEGKVEDGKESSSVVA